MEPDFLRIAGDWSIVLLALEGILLSLIPFFILRALTRWLGGILPTLPGKLIDLRQKAEQFLAAIERAMAQVCAPFIRMHGAVAGMRAFWRDVMGNRS